MAELIAYTEEIKNHPRLLGRDVELCIEFFVPGVFESMYAANRWCLDNGYSYGSTCAPSPYQGLIKHLDVNIAKWKNLTKQEIATLDGVMVTIGDRREGKMRIVIFKK